MIDRYPLRAKKAFDYGLWRRAVDAWANKDYEGMRTAKAQLAVGRVYRRHSRED